MRSTRFQAVPRYKKWECSNTSTEARCVSLQKLIEETKRDIPDYQDKGKVVLARDDDQYIATRNSLRDSKGKMDTAMSEFLRADCENSSKEPYCQGKDGSVVQVKAAYNKSLGEIKSNPCEKMQAPRFTMAKDVYEGSLPATQDGLTPKPVSGDRENTEGDRLPAPAEPNFFMHGWNAFMNSMKSPFSWFGK
jgi:hypothetical protein